MNVNVLYDVTVSSTSPADCSTATCAYPLSVVLDNDEILCLYRQGKTKHSNDGILLCQRSVNHGRNWSKPTVIFDGRKLDPPQAVSSGGICRCLDGTVVVFFSVLEVSTDAYCFSREGLGQVRRCYSVHSHDQGQHWTPPNLVLRDQRVAGISSSPLLLPDGALLMVIEYSSPDGEAVVGTGVSRDNGVSVDTFVPTFIDPTGKLSHCDARFMTLPDGTLVAMLWTYRNDNEETVEVHRSVSVDGGRSWTPPVPAGALGQITAPLLLESATILAASNFRQSPQGIRLWLSRDRGCTWDQDAPIQMWDADREESTAEPIENNDRPSIHQRVWNALPDFRFGTPNLLKLSEHSILLTYYATINGVTSVRACRFVLSTDKKEN